MVETPILERRSRGDIETPVLIAGAGPVGLALAIELARRGIPCVVLDESDGTITFPTGESLNARTMEHFRRWGIADQVRHAGFPLDYRRNVRFVTRVMRHQLTWFERASNGEAAPAEAAVSPEWTTWCPKFFLDPVLRAHATSFPLVDLRFGWRLQTLTPDADRVTAEVVEVTSGRTERLTASYLVGCDGGASTVRHEVGILLEGAFAEGFNLGIYFRAPTLLETNPHGGATQYWLVNRDGRGPLSAVDGRTTWRLSLEYPREQLDQVDAAQVVRTALGADLPFDILDVRPWAGHRVVAERYQAGRVFLAGDAAHLMWPRGGFGLNTGIGDAVDLSWKLAATLQGWGGPGLLASYDIERRPVGWRNVNMAAENRAAEMAVPVPDHLEDDTELGASERAWVAAEIIRLRSKEWASLGIALGYRYESAIVIPDGSPPPSDAPSIYEPTARPGSRAPHAWLSDGRSTLDCFGLNFTLLCLDPGADTASFARAAAECGLPLAVVLIKDHVVANLFGCHLALVRPDGHVAWRDNAPSTDPGAVLDQVRGA